MKKFNSTILLTMLLCMIEAKGYAHDIEVANTDGVTIYYVWVNNKTELAVSYRGNDYNSYSNEYTGNLAIPKSVVYDGKTYNVTSLGRFAFCECIGLTSVTIPNSVTSIEVGAFRDCIGLTSITIPNSVTSIGSDAFWNCSGLTSITIPNSVTSIGQFAFYNCFGLNSVEFHCKEIAAWFTGLHSIKTVVIGEEVTSIGESAFSNCSGLASVTIPNSVTNIGNYAFRNCSGLTSVTIPNSVTSIGNYAFNLCNGLTSVTIPNSVTSIGESAFDGCSGLTSVTVLCSPSKLGYNIFNNCKNIKEVVFDCETITSLFNGKPVLQKVIIKDSVTSIGENAFSNCSGLTSITIPNSVISIGNYAFSGCIGLTSVTIPNSVSSIGKNAFEGCSGLTSITIPNSVTNIGEYTFYQCIGLTSITIPNSVTSIGESAFEDCIGLNSITIPNSVTSIGNSAFRNCSGLNSVTIPNSVTSIGALAFVNCNGLISVSIPNSVTSIGALAFDGCSGLISVVIGSGVTSIGNSAFSNTPLKKTIWLTNTPPAGFNNASGAINYVSNEQYNIGNKVVYPFLSSCFEADGIRYVPVSPSERTCDAIDCTYDSLLTCITIPSMVTYQGISMTVDKVQPYIFFNNKYIQSMTLGDKVTSIGDGAFGYCSSLKSMVIPQNITSINNYVFDGCTGLKEFIIEDREDELTLGSNGSSPMFSSCPLDNVYIGGNISYKTQKDYGFSPFYRNTSLRTVIITDKETEISENEFYGCTNLHSFAIGDGVEKFGDWAFSGCSSLESLSFGSKLKTIGKEAFSDCVSVTEITSKAVTPPNCGTQALDDINKWNCKLVVPKGSLSQYQAADQWKDFFFISEGNYGGDTPDNPDNKKCAKPTISYNKGELLFASDTEDVEFVSTISDTDIATYTTSSIQLDVTYNISVYATKSGYENSETATATLCWIDVDPKTEGITGIVSNVRAKAVLIQSNGNVLSVSGAPKGAEINVYSLSGQKVGSAKVASESTDVITTLNAGEVGIVKIDEKAMKVAIK